MGFISKTFNLKMMARKLDKKPAAAEKPVREVDGEFVTIQELSDYVFQKLFLPILRYGYVPTQGLDFEQISHEDLDDLYSALERTQAFEFFSFADAFLAMPPATARKATFI